MPLSNEEIRNMFGYHRPDAESAELQQDIRNEFQAQASYLNRVLPDGKAKSVVMAHLEEGCMWANKAVAQQNPVVNE